MTLTVQEQEERDIMILKLTAKAKKLQDELREIQMTLQRLNLLRQEKPKDQFNDDIPDTELKKHLNKAKSEFDRMIPSSTAK